MTDKKVISETFYESEGSIVERRAQCRFLGMHNNKMWDVLCQISRSREFGAFFASALEQLGIGFRTRSKIKRLNIFLLLFSDKC